MDSNDCTYPVELLQQWKEIHEQLMRTAIEGLPSAHGWIHRVSAQGLGPFRNEVSITLGHRTALTGRNGVGKTLLMNQLACLSSRRRRKTWADGSRWNLPGQSSQTTIEVYGHERNVLHMHRDRDGLLDYRINGDRPPLFPDLGKVVFLGQDEEKETSRSTASVEAISSIFDLDPADALQLLSSRKFSAVGLVHEFEFADGELRARAFSDHPLVPWRAMSPYEVELVLMDLAIAVADYFADIAPTVLILDAIPASLTTSIGGERLVWIIKERPHILAGFQVVFSGCAPELPSILPVDQAYELVEDPGKAPSTRQVLVQPRFPDKPHDAVALP